ncbi:MAG: DUF1016 N-terminal domain-containing protein, partial [bacterium]|nr:DUF1016 N-terminal domain-containing protein [bacterium]
GQLSEHLTVRFGRGYSLPNLKRMRRFYQTYAVAPESPTPGIENHDQIIGSALWSQLVPTTHPQFQQVLGWSHYRLLMTVSDPAARSFYEVEAAREGWSSRELERQIASLHYERDRSQARQAHSP